MHLSDHYHHIDSALERIVQGLKKLESAVQGAIDQIGRNEHRVPRAIFPLLERAWSLVRAGFHHTRMALAQQIAELYEDSFDDAGIAFASAISPGVSIEGEPMQLSRLVSNLLDNAIKYVPAGGHVELRVEPGPRLVVADDGPGIPEAELQHAGERFFRGSNVHQPGTGLGLAIVQAIAQRHAATLQLQPGAGQRGLLATLVFTDPAA